MSLILNLVEFPHSSVPYVTSGNLLSMLISNPAESCKYWECGSFFSLHGKYSLSFVFIYFEPSSLEESLRRCGELWLLDGCL